jgi:glycosyltransferase involved in cell wall biosynthesis
LRIAYSGKGRLHSRHQALLGRLVDARSARVTTVVDPLRFLAECDVTVLPYPSSSIHHPPLVMIESMAAGTPVVTTDVGGLSEIIVDGQTGFLVPPGDVGRLADRIGWLANHAAETGRMGQAAFCRFEQSLCREVCCGQMESILLRGRDSAR